jgi:predicted ATPase
VNNDKTPLLDDPSFESKSLEEKAQLLKAQGNKMFQVRNYRKASELFTRAIDLLLEVPDSDEKKTNLAVLYNNYSACMEYEVNHFQAKIVNREF